MSRLPWNLGGDLVDQITTGGNSITRLDYLSDGSRRIADHFTQYDPGNGVPTSATTSFAYAAGETKVTGPNGNFTTNDTTDGITTYRFDDRDRITKVIDTRSATPRTRPTPATTTSPPLPTRCKSRSASASTPTTRT
jgi:hypothetical protein